MLQNGAQKWKNVTIRLMKTTKAARQVWGKNQVLQFDYTTNRWWKWNIPWVEDMEKFWVLVSVADPGCLSRIPDPDFYPSRIPDHRFKNSNKREGWKKICCHNFLCCQIFHKIAHYFSFDVLKKKIWASFQRIIELFTQKIVNKLSKIWIWDPGSGKNLFRIPNPGSRGRKGTGSRIPDPQHLYFGKLTYLLLVV